jgi:hypothetical protein
MKKALAILLLSLLLLPKLFAGSVEKTYHFNGYQVTRTGDYQSVCLDNTLLSGLPGEPALPYREVMLMLPPGEAAESIGITFGEETVLPGRYVLYPQQDVRPLSWGSSGHFLKNEAVYSLNQAYPQKPGGKLITQYLNGYAFALSSFTPLQYNPATGRVSYYGTVTVRIITRPDDKARDAMKNLSPSGSIRDRARSMAQNPEMAEVYPAHKSTRSTNPLLIVTPDAYKDNYGDLTSMYSCQGISSEIVTLESIGTTFPGADLQEKIRNCIIDRYQNAGAEYVILGGNAGLVPFRGFYVSVLSQGSYVIDSVIPADIYYSALDGNWNTNGNNYWGEPGEDDLLPDISVARLPFDNATELAAMIHKSVSYQTDPVNGEFQEPFMVGEHLYDNPVTEGGTYLDLLIDTQSANGYYTHGIPTATNDIEKMYDELISPGSYHSWGVDSLLAKLNRGKQFIWHCGHSNEIYMMRLMNYDITNANFSHVNGIDHNYELMYSHGCLCGAFDTPGCIAAQCLKINNFLAAGIFNSRFGWFNEGTSEGPSEHINREFVSALYNDTTPEKHIGTTHLISKVKTAPWITAPGQWEPGAIRWCDYCCNVLGDAALSIRTQDLPTGIVSHDNDPVITVFPNPATDAIQVQINATSDAVVRLSLVSSLGQHEAVHGTSATVRKGNNTLTLGLSGVAAGNYFVKIQCGNSAWYKRITVTR